MHHTTNHFKRIRACVFCIVFVACWAPQPSESAADAPAQTDSAQHEQKTWARTFGGPWNENLLDLDCITDGGFILAGTTASKDYTDGDAYLLRLSASGEKVWCRTYGGDNLDSFNNVTETVDGGLIAVGWTQSSGAEQQDIYLVKTDPNGVEQWHRIIGNDSVEMGQSIAPTPDGGYVIAGIKGSLGPDACGGNVLKKHTALLLKIDGDGNQLWQHTFDGEENSFGTAVRLTSDGGFMLAGMQGNIPFGSPKRGLLIKTDDKGNELFSKTYCDELLVNLADVKQTSDGGYIAIGSSESAPAGRFDFFLIRTDSEGTELWHRTYGTPEFHEHAYSVLETPDNHFVLAGGAQRTDDDLADLLLMKVDANGTEIWQRWFGGAVPEKATKVISTPDGGYIIGGFSYPCPQQPDSDCYVVKTDSNGQGPPHGQATWIHCPELAATQ